MSNVFDTLKKTSVFDDMTKERTGGSVFDSLIAKTTPPEAPSKLEVWTPSLKEKIKLSLTDALERSPFYERGKRLGQLGVHYLSEAISGLGLYIPDVIASKISDEDTLAEALDTITGFTPTPREVGAGEATKFITSLSIVGKIVGPIVAKIPAMAALKAILSSGLTFMSRKAVEEVAEKITKDESISVEGIHFEGGIGVLFGAGAVGVSKFIKFISKLRALPKAQLRPAREEVRAAIKNWKKTGDRTQWDAVRIKYAGIDPEVLGYKSVGGKIVPKTPPPPVKEFGKFPLAKAVAPAVKAPVAEPIIPQSTAIVKSTFAEWATDYSATRARDLGVPLLLKDSSIMEWRRMTLKEVENSQRRYKKTYQKKLARREHPDVFNPWISARHAFMSLGEKTGVPLYHIYDNIMRKGGAANIRGFEEISSRIGIGELSKLTLEDNTMISEWLFSPETRVRTTNIIKPHALEIAKKLDEILQGPAAKQVQEMVARRWIRSGKAPPDVWNYPTGVIVNKWMSELKDHKGITRIVRGMLRDGIPSRGKLIAKITRAAKKEGWRGADESLAIKVLSDKNVQAEIGVMRTYPRKVLESVTKAKAEKRLPDHIANDAPWTMGLGVRKFYYMSDPAKADIIDDYIDNISLRALDRPAIPEGTMPGTISYEAFARRGDPGIKKGSVVNNVLTHLQRISIANAVADDMEMMYDRLTQQVKDPLTGKDVARIPLNNSDSKTIKDIFNNLLMKRQIVSRPWAPVVEVKRWFWRTRLSLAARPDAAIWMSFRNAIQNIGMGPAAFNVKQTGKSMIQYAAQRASGKTMEQIDPGMYSRFQRDFPSYVSQRMAFYREFLLQDTANVSREFGNRRVAQKAAALLERTGGLYGWVDEWVNRMPLWIAQYQTTKNAAVNYKMGQITINDFLAKTGLDTVRAEQKMMAQDLLDAGRIDDLAAESANWMVEDVNLKYKTAERAGVSQTMSQRIFMGIYNFPRGAVELWAYRGVIPMMKGVETGNWKQAQHGLTNLLKGIAAGELAATILIAVIGKSAYDIWSKSRYELLGPGAGTISDLLGSISMISINLSRGDITLPQAADRLADTFSNNIDEFMPLMNAFQNIIETQYDTKSLNSWRLLRDTTMRKVLGEHAKWERVSRSDYEKVMHMIIGSFEDPQKYPKSKWDNRFNLKGLEKWK